MNISEPARILRLEPTDAPEYRALLLEAIEVEHDLLARAHMWRPLEHQQPA